MSQDKTEMPQGWIQMPRQEGKQKISHYFKGDNSACAEVDLPKDGVLNNSPSIRCEKCIDKNKAIDGDQKDDESPKQDMKDDAPPKDTGQEDDEEKQVAPPGHHTTGNISSPGSG